MGGTAESAGRLLAEPLAPWGKKCPLAPFTGGAAGALTFHLAGARALRPVGVRLRSSPSRLPGGPKRSPRPPLCLQQPPPPTKRGLGPVAPARCDFLPVPPPPRPLCSPQQPQGVPPQSSTALRRQALLCEAPLGLPHSPGSAHPSDLPAPFRRQVLACALPRLPQERAPLIRLGAGGSSTVLGKSDTTACALPVSR